MRKIKYIIKALTPPVVLYLIRLLKKQKQIQEMWSGDYHSWAEAKSRCTGYESDVILEKCKSALLEVKNGRAVSERDSVLFDDIQYSWGLLAGLQRAALKDKGRLCVLDFGGSLGSSFYQNREYLSMLKELKWCIVEQPHFVTCGIEYFEDDHLSFYSTIEECLAKNEPNVLLLSGVLQYLDKPYEWIQTFIELGIPNIIIDRNSTVDNGREILTVQNVPESIYKASYPAWFFNKEKLINFFRSDYYLLSRFVDTIDPPIKLNGMNASWGGLYFIKK
jgi:putative methyltransferase (TIGR04325 family)